MIKVVILVLLAFFKDDGDTDPSFHYQVVPFESMEACQAGKAEAAARIIPPNSTVASAVCYEQTLDPKDSI